jgi:thiamine biosynthesis protein ThiI
VFTPRHPCTRPQLEDVLAAEAALDVEALTAKSLAGIKQVRIKSDGTMTVRTPAEP